ERDARLQSPSDQQPRGGSIREHSGSLRSHACNHAERQPNIYGANARPLKSGGSDADDCEGLPINCDRLPNNGRIAVESACPAGGTKHGIGARAPSPAIHSAEEPPRARERAEYCKVIGRDESAINTLGACGIAEAQRLREERIGVHAIKRGGALTKVNIVGIRVRAEAGAATTAPNVYEFARFGDAHRRTE